MRIAVPSSVDEGLDGCVEEHFGRSPYYVFVDVENGEIVDVKVEETGSTEHTPGQLPQYLKRNGVDVVVAMGMGRRARSWFEQLGIEVVTGAQGRIKDVLEAYLRKELRSVQYEPRHRFRGRAC